MVIEELWRICKKDAIIRIEVPYYNNKGAFNDMQHEHYFSEVTFKNFVEERKMINKKRRFEILMIELIPTRPGKLIPKFIRRKLALFIGGFISQVHVEFRVIKQNSGF